MDYKAKVLRVIDGDTLEAAVEIWPEITVITRVRVVGVDCPEMRSKDEGEVKRAIEAKRFTYEQVQGADVRVTVFGKDSFGRVLCSVIYDSRDLAKELIANGHAKTYRAPKTTAST